MAKARHRLVVVGGGYGGVRAARDLARRESFRGEIILVSDQELHVEVPSLYEVATAYLEQESVLSSEYICQGIGAELRDMFRGLPVTVRVASVYGIHAHERCVVLSDKTALAFDWLVLALGAVTNTYNIPGVSESAFPLKTLSDALRLRHHIVSQAFRARAMKDRDQRVALTFVIVGAGASGVETASELKGLLDRLCPERGIDPRVVQVLLVEAGDMILRELPASARFRAQRRLERLGVRVLTRKRVTLIQPRQIMFEDGTSIETATVIWTGGLAPHPVLVRSGLPIKNWGVATRSTLQVAGHSNIFAGGDCAVIIDQAKPLPAIVPVAYRQGAVIAENLERLMQRKPLKPFHYRTRGQLISIGGQWAVAVLLPGLTYVGWLPWVVKKLVLLRYWLQYLSWRQAWQLWWGGVRIQTKND